MKCSVNRYMDGVRTEKMDQGVAGYGKMAG